MAEDVADRKRKGIPQCSWGVKSKLERNLIIILIVIIALFIALLLYVIIKPAVMKRRCITKGCLLAASEIVTRVNPEIDPCNDPVAFAYAKSKNHLDLGVGIEQDLIEILKAAVSDHDHFLLKAEKLLFQSCMEDHQDNVTVIDALISDLDWPIVTGYQWRDQNFDWQQLVFKLRKNGFPFEMILQVQVVKEGPTYTVKISPPNIKNVTDSIEIYKKYMVDVAMLFGAEFKRAESEMEKVFYFSQHLKKVCDNHTGSVSTTISNYLENNADIDWLNYINNILYPVNQLSLDDYAQFPTKEFTDELSNLLYRTPKRVIANYIIWSALETSMPFMPHKFKEKRLPYECHTKSEPISREALCRQILQSFVPDPVQIVYARKQISKICRAKITRLFQSVKEEFVDAINKTSLLDEDARNRSMGLISELVPVIGMTGDYFNDSIMEKESWPGYHGRVAPKSTFFEMVLEENFRYRNNQFHKVRKTGEQEIYPPVASTSPTLDLEGKTMILPIGVLNEEMFSEDRPMYLNYAILGKLIAAELTKVISDEYIEYPDCSIDSNEDMKNDTLISEYLGTQIAYSAYGKWIKQNNAERLLPGIIYDPYQLFWIFSIDSRTSTVLGSNDDYGRDFNCPANPSPKKCKIF